MAGIVLTASGFNAQLGGMAQGLDGVMHQWNAMRLYVTGAGGGTAGLQAAPLSLTSADATIVFNTAADIGNELWQIYTGAATQASFRAGAFDYRTNLNLVAGTDVHLMPDLRREMSCEELRLALGYDSELSRHGRIWRPRAA